MPSPIAHVAAGAALYWVGRRYVTASPPERIGPLPALALVTVGFSLLPDMDSLVGLVAGDFGRFHNNLTHSVVAGAAASTLFATLITWYGRGRFRYWFAAAFTAYLLHILMDSATIGRGVMAFWPFTSDRYQFPWLLFYGLHWSDGLLSPRHWWTLLTESAFALVLLSLTRYVIRET
ncbi:MAG: metal-dependent hydrolase [Anaerolineae bacterium]|nr:metal-dependent hydrolase [Anaerolineae bacterium]